MTHTAAGARDPEAVERAHRWTLPAGLAFHYVSADERGHHRVDAHVPDELHGTRPIGLIVWRPGDGEVLYVHTDHSVRRRGVATALWHEAQAYALRAGLAAPRHSLHQTRAGTAWAHGTAKQREGQLHNSMRMN